MRSIERKFNNIQEKKPFWSSYICFAETISNSNFSKDLIRRWFNKLVDRDDYAQEEKRRVLNYLYTLSNKK